MKKLFTIFAVIGFSTITFANNHLEVKKLQIKTSVLAVQDECEAEQAATFDLYLSNGTSYWEAYFAGARAWGECMGQ